MCFHTAYSNSGGGPPSQKFAIRYYFYTKSEDSYGKTKIATGPPNNFVVATALRLA